MKNLPKGIFQKLMENLKQESDDLDNLGMRAKYKNWEISFHDEGNGVIVDDFGKLTNRKWVQYQPTKREREIMDMKLDDLYGELTQVAQTYEYEKPYEEYDNSI